MLYKYLVHRACNLPFTTAAHVIERDSVFVPAGWDTEKKLDILKESTRDVEMPLEVVFTGSCMCEWHSFSFYLLSLLPLT